MSYYNTTNETQPQLELSWEKTKSQDHIVMNIFTNHPKGLTAFEAWNVYQSYGFRCPQTSIRRSITDLMNDGKLVMTTDKRLGGYGKSNYVYVRKK